MATFPKALVHRVFVVTLLVLAASGCATGYGARGLTGGYSDERIDDTHHLVKFNGNGYASKERVWNFWFYRCAELTAEKGFAYFDLETKKDGKQSLLDAPPPATRPASSQPTGGGLVVVPAGYTYYYSPGTTVTTWNSSAVVAMYPAIPAGKTLFSAKRVLEQLDPYVKSDGSGTAPERNKLFRGALVKLGASQAEERVFPEGVTIGYVDWKRVLAGTSEGKAAQARLQAFYAKKQAELDAGKAQLDKLRSGYDAEPDAARKAALESDIAAKKKQLKALFDRSQADLEAEQKRNVSPIIDRAGPIVERIRSAQHLDTVTEQYSGGLWDADITAEVIRQYEERYPVNGAT